jgi:DNA-binding NarL/FixJ family response regulator
MKFILIDDHQLVRDGFKRLIETREHWQVVAEAGSYQTALAALDHLKNGAIDIAIIDISLPDANGIELVTYCTENYPKLKTIIMSMYDQNPYISNALDAGVNGYISKRSASEELLTGIETVMGGDTYLSQDVINKLHIGQAGYISQGLEKLTGRELEILPLFARGLNAKQVSQQLNIMPKTAHVHRANIFKKLMATNNIDLLKIALNEGMISLDEL